MTYGDYQEIACIAIAELLRSEPSFSSTEANLVLASRANIIATVVERMEHLGAAFVTEPATKHRSTHVSVVRQPLYQLAKVVDELERPAWGDVAPSDVLQTSGQAESGVGETWRTAARNLFLATTELVRAEQQPWLTHPETGWPLVADLADVVEGLVLLDAHLRSAGLLPRWPRRLITARLLVASDVGRIARLAKSDAVADLASAGWGARSAGDGPGITLVRSVNDLAGAQRRLASLVRPLTAQVDVVPAEDRPGLRTARVLAAGQTSLNVVFASWAERAGRTDLAREFADRIGLYRQLHSASTRVVDMIPNRSTLPLIQQAEISTQIRQLRRTPPGDRQLEDLNCASGCLAVALGRSLRREGLQVGRIQSLTARGQDLPIPKPISNDRHPFHVACKALADSHPDSRQVVATLGRAARRELRETLDQVTLRTSTPIRRMSRATATAGRGLS